MLKDLKSHGLRYFFVLKNSQNRSLLKLGGAIFKGKK